MRVERHPRITALRALALLRRLERDGSNPSSSTLGEVKDALAEHVAAELVRGIRRRAKVKS